MTDRRAGGLFAHAELSAEPRLRWVCAALLFFFYWTFSRWYGDPALSAAAAPSIDVIGTWALGEARLPLPGLFWAKAYMALLGLLALAGLAFLFRGRTAEPTLVLGFLFVNKLLFYLSDSRLMSNVHHTHLLFTLAFLVGVSKLFFLRLMILEAYVLAAAAKFTPSWLLGEYLNSLPGKLPLAPKAEALVTALSLGLVAWELLGPWLWLSRRRALREGAVWVFAGFHLFSVTMVGVDYPALMLPVLLAAFWRFERPLQAGYRYAPSHLPAWALAAAAALAGLRPFAIPGDARLTGEGRWLGLHFSETNRSGDLQVEIEKDGRLTAFEFDWPWTHEAARPRFEARLYDRGRLVETLERPAVLLDGETVLLNPSLFTNAAPNALEPYLVYAWAKGLCRRYRPERLGIRFRLAIDGHAYRHPLIDAEDFCASARAYRPFGRNDWIRLPGPEAPSSYRWRH